MNRRDFVVSGAATAAALSASAFAVATITDEATNNAALHPLPYRIIFDRRFQESCSFGASAAQLGCAIQPIAGDITALWFNELQPRWARGEGAIVGMTTMSSLLCLEQLAWQQWMRVVARVEHHSEPDGTLCHRLHLNGSTLREARIALADNSHWSERIVAPLVRRLAIHHVGRPVESAVFTRRRSHAGRNLALVSWVIANRSRGVAQTGFETLHATEVAPT
ncbi:MAG TPA: hypothetical protein VGN77_06380 [Steroidobacteraceae bacterium]|nr:hypothetical protein [Steroidobacteraceae bacterium]